MPARSKSEFLFDALISTPSDSHLEHSITSGVETSLGPVRCFHKRENDQIGLIIPCSKVQFERFVPDKKSHAIHLTRLQIGDEPQVRLTLQEPRQIKVFYLFVDDLLARLDEKPKNAPNAAAACLDDWRRFFKVDAEKVLSVEEEIGLLCELEVLLALIKQGYSEAVERWVGPLQQHHDFEFPDYSIECKATKSSTHLMITIHGAEQLTPTPDKQLTLVVRRYQSDPDGKLSIPTVCEQIVSCLEVPVAAFMDKVRMLGIDPWDSAQSLYFSKFNAIDGLEFEIVEGFPTVDLRDNDHRITNMQFSIDLAGASTIPGYKSNPIFLNT